MSKQKSAPVKPTVATISAPLSFSERLAKDLIEVRAFVRSARETARRSGDRTTEHKVSQVLSAVQKMLAIPQIAAFVPSEPKPLLEPPVEHRPPTVNREPAVAVAATRPLIGAFAADQLPGLDDPNPSPEQRN